MKLNRRNALIGLGAVATGGGALFGSGAFSTVDASRSVSISTSADSAAQVQFTTSGGIGGSNGDTIQFSESDINADAVTTYTGALTITIPSSTEGTNFDVTITDGSSNDILYTSSETPLTSSDPELVFVGSSDPLTLDTSGGTPDSVSLDVKVNTLGQTSTGSFSTNSVQFTVTDTT